MACGIWDEDWGDANTPPLHHKQDVFAVWDRTDLQRAHITPRYKDPDQSDDAARLVLLCGSCHSKHPDFDDDDASFAWMRRRTLLDVVLGVQQ